MDTNLMDKLRLLRLDTALRPLIKMKPMSRFYFSCSSSASEQFFAFASVAVWLAKLSGGDLEQPREEDDPNVTIASIVELLRNRGAAVDFSTHKLKQGYGEQVLYILNKLANDALKAQGFHWNKPVIQEADEEHENADDNDQVEDETEIVLEKLEDEMGIYSDESEEEYPNDMEDKGTSAPSDASIVVAKPAHDWHSWRLELERVAPALRLLISGDGRDWRARLEKMTAYRQELQERYKTTGTQLSKLQNSLSSCMDKMAARENILNEQFEPLVKEYGLLLDQLEKVNNEYKEASVGITERQEILNELNTKVESVKLRTESRGSSMNDDSPLVNAKKAVSLLKKEIQDMDYQITVLMWLLTTKDSPSNNIVSNYNSRLTTAESY